MAALVSNPDGSSAVVVVPQSGTSVAVTSTVINSTTQTNGFKIQRDFTEEHDRVALENMQRMNKQDAVYRSQHDAAEPEFAKMFQQDAISTANYETYVTYNAKGSAHDASVRAAINAADVAVQQAVATHAAGPNPIYHASDPQAVATPGMDWLERMKAQDEALKMAVERSDAQLRP